jgi:hypothetical protein
MLAKLNLGATALVFVAFGLWGLLKPGNMVGNLGLALTSGAGATAIRAMYGGFLIGAGILFGYSAIAPGMDRFGLIALGTIVGAILAARVFGMIVDNAFVPIQITYAGIEVISSIATISLLLYAKSIR